MNSISCSRLDFYFVPLSSACMLSIVIYTFFFSVSNGHLISKQKK